MVIFDMQGQLLGERSKDQPHNFQLLDKLLLRYPTIRADLYSVARNGQLTIQTH